ncbi:MAG: MFS transporter [Ruminococcaceae bacterium]|nr:MFS transporter [Oscillospiraceae bacterium]
MANSISKRARAMCCLLTLVYFASYTMRINFAVMIVKVCSDMQLEKSALAIVLTGLTVAYGAGQVINGFVGDKIAPRTMISVGLALAAACNMAMYFSHNLVLMTVIWTINGFAHSMLWPPIVRTMTENFRGEEYSYAAVRVSWGSSIATILLYLVCPFLLGYMSWRSIIAICSLIGVAVLVLWIPTSKRLFQNTISAKKDISAPDAHSPLPRYAFIPVVLIMLGIIFQGMLRDGVTNWVPSLLNESFGISEENAIFVTVIPAIFSMIVLYAFDILHRKLLKNEVFCATVIFGAAMLFGAVMYLCDILSPSALLSTLFVTLIIACMHGINLMLISIAPKRFAKSGKVSTFSGILNSCTYIGASVATPLFAALAEGSGWSACVLSWAVISALGLTVCLLAFPLWRKFRREYSDI